MRLIVKTACLFCLALLATAPVRAADPMPVAMPPAPVDVPFTRSLLFSPLEVTMIERAVAGNVAGSSMLEAGKAVQQQIPLRRLISVAGLLWRSDADWIVWLNGKKVTPKSLLPEIVDIKVSRDAVTLKWFDIGINGVISLTLRPHQTYDIVTGVLLPG